MDGARIADASCFQRQVGHLLEVGEQRYLDIGDSGPIGADFIDPVIAQKHGGARVTQFLDPPLAFLRGVLLESGGPLTVLLLTVTRIDEGFPREPPAKSIRLICLDLTDDVLEIPGRLHTSGKFEFVETESYLVSL